MDDTDTGLILRLLEQPDASNKDLAAHLGVSQATISRRRKNLEKEGILLGKQLLINFPRLGLRLYHLLLIPSEPYTKQMLKFQLFFKNHHYTAYQNRVYGKYNGLMVQLNLPDYPRTERLLRHFLDQIQAAGLLQDYRLFVPGSNYIHYAIDTSSYDMATRRFHIDYTTIRKRIRTEYPPFEYKRNIQPRLELLDPDNFKILRQLYIDASRTLREIGQAAGGFSKQEVSRRMKEMNVSSWQYATRYDRTQFGVFNQALYILNEDLTALASLDQALAIFPFPATVRPCKEHLLLSLLLPAVDATRFTDILKERFTTVELHLLGRQPLGYPPWEANIVDGKWQLSPDILGNSYTTDGKFIPLAEFFEQLDGKTVEELEGLLHGDTQ